MEKLDFSRYAKKGIKPRGILKFSLILMVVFLLTAGYLKQRENFNLLQREMGRVRTKKDELKRTTAATADLEERLFNLEQREKFFLELVPENRINSITRKIFFNFPQNAYIVFFRGEERGLFLIEGYFSQKQDQEQLEEKLSGIFPKKNLTFSGQKKETLKEGHWRWFALELERKKEEN